MNTHTHTRLLSYLNGDTLQWGRRRKSLMELTKMKKQDKGSSLSIGEVTWLAIENVLMHCLLCVREALAASQPELHVVLNPQKPRRNSFEVTLMEGDKAEVVLWSGIKKGPPRKLKFPDPAEVVSALKEALVHVLF
uniref:Selenoprotein H n=1 Tax=Sinocyclocheilus anshuiensis TaxID=1608454 RepID=A0A671MSM3_9TELE